MNNTMNMGDRAKSNVSFAAIDQYIDTNIVSPKEKAVPSKDMVEWGDSNAYPDYLLELFNEVPTLRSIISGNVDYIAGDDVQIQPINPDYGPGEMNSRGDDIRSQVRDIARDLQMYGGCAFQVIRNAAGEVCEVYYLDMRFLRCNKDRNVFYYCEKWSKTGKKDTLVYPAFMPHLNWGALSDEERMRHASSVYYVSNTHTQVYPSPLYAAAVKACEIERCIDDYHLNAINNGFVSSMIINFNNGVPEDEVKEEIESDFNDKFSGHQNAGRIMFSWNKSKETATEVITPSIEDFGDRYQALSEHSRQQIFTAFRATPSLFGIVDKTGFNSVEYAAAFKLYNRTQILPFQRIITDAYDRIYGKTGVLTIVPFTMDGAGEGIVK